MSRLSDISSSPVIREYAQGAAQSAMNPVADFLAPTVGVATSTGKYKRYTEKSRFRIPNTERSLGGDATKVLFNASDGTYNCTPHALDYPVDKLEQIEAGDLENVLQEGADTVAEIAALAHERDVITKALDSLGAGTDQNFLASSFDPVDFLDQKILDVIKAAKYGSLMGVGVLFGATAWRLFKNNAEVIKRVYGGGNGGKPKSVRDSDASALLIGDPEIKTSLLVQDNAAEGLAEDIDFLLDSNIIVFARHPSPTRRDPSFMKTFRLRNKWMVPGTYETEDGRADVAKYDWSEDVQVTNSTAGVRINTLQA